MRLSYCLLAGFIFSAFTSAAQLGFGPEVGFNLSNYTGKSDGKKISHQPKYGGMFGGILEVELNEHFYLLPGLFDYRNGYAKSFAGGTKTYAVNTLEIPVNIEYKFGRPDRVKFFVGAGPYFDLNYDGTVVTSALPVYSTYDIKMGNDASDDIRSFDIGVGVFGVYQITRGLFFRARYQYGFLNMLPEGNSNNSLYNRSFSLSVGYVFPGDLKAKKEPEKIKEEEEREQMEQQRKQQ